MATSQTTFTGTVTAGTFSGSGASLTSIPRSALNPGTANQVVVNDGSGNLTSQAELSVALGGTGQNFSGVGAGPFVVEVSSGTFSASTAVTSTNTASAIVTRDASGNFAANNVTANEIIYTLATISGGSAYEISTNVQTTNATATTIATLATASGTDGTAYGLRGVIVSGTTAGSDSTGYYEFNVKVKNIAGTLTASSLGQYTTILDAGLSTTSVTVTVSGTNILVQVTGVAATTINWAGYFILVSQQF